MHKTHIKLDKDNLSFHITKSPDLFENWIKARYPLASENHNLFSSVSREVCAFVCMISVIDSRFNKIRGLLIAFRESLLHELGEHVSILDEAYSLWKDIPKCADVQEFRKKLEKKLEREGLGHDDLPNDNLENGVLAAQIIRDWRLAAQTAEIGSEDPVLVKHHQERVLSSKQGPLNRPGRTVLPTKYQTSESDLVKAIVFMLSRTAHNWASWINGRHHSHGVLFAHFVMAILSADPGLVKLVNSSKYRPLIYLMEHSLAQFKTKKRGTWVKEQEETGEVTDADDIDMDTLRKHTDIPMTHQVAVHSEKDRITSEIKSTLSKLWKLGLEHGRIDGRWNPNAASGMESMALASHFFITL